MHFGKRLIAQIIEKPIEDPLVDKIFDKVYEKFMEEVDANDNGIATHDGKARYAVTTTLASRVANLRPHWNDPNQDFDKVQCGNFMIFLHSVKISRIFLSCTFYVKSKLEGS